jgi:hypothetical protein
MLLSYILIKLNLISAPILKKIIHKFKTTQYTAAAMMLLVKEGSQ